MGYRLVQAVLVVTLGRLGDMFGRVRIYNAGFVVFTFASILLSFDPFDGGARRDVADRLAGAAGARRVDADRQLGRDPHRRVPGRAARLRPGHQPGRGAGRASSSDWWPAACWRRSTGARCSGSTCPSAIFGTVWAYRTLRDNGRAPRPAHRLVGQRHLRGRLGALLIGITVRASSPTTGTRWAGPTRWSSACSPAASLLLARVRRHRDAASPSRCSSSACSGSARSRPATSPALAVAIARGGLQFMLIIWLQGIWLPLHGYDYSAHPAVGRHLPAAADRRVPRRRARRPGSSPTGFGARGLATRRDGRVRRQLHRPDAPARRLPLLGVRGPDRRQRDRLGHVRRAQHLVDHEQRPGPIPRRGLRHALRPSRTPARRCRSACSSR